jgi:hypothetical protein
MNEIDSFKQTAIGRALKIIKLNFYLCQQSRLAETTFEEIDTSIVLLFKVFALGQSLIEDRKF